ncbi:MBL fold metallo-hydrolase [Pedobacter hartonius]|nr:MBL fold metallo-hydrolase [Pedobacter hartonius]
MKPAKKMDAYKRYYSDNTSIPNKDAVKVTYLGVTSLLLDDGKTQLLVDCFFSRPSVFKVATSKVSTDTALVNTVLSQYKINRLKGIFISHSHYDHAFDAAYVAKKTNANLLGSQSTLSIGKGGGLSNNKMALFKDGWEQQFGDFNVSVIASRHSPATPLNDDLGKNITESLIQPAKVKKYVEGGSYDFLIKHKGYVIYIKASANYIPEKLKGLRADALFLAVGTLGKRDSVFMNNYYQETVAILKPKIVVPIHWDNFLQPLSDHLEMMPRVMDDTYKAFDLLIGKTRDDNFKFEILQGGKSIVLSK